MTATPDISGRNHPVEVAVEFVAAQRGGAKRLLDAHREGADGYCVGCVVVPTRWPCTAARIATAAEKSNRKKRRPMS